MLKDLENNEASARSASPLERRNSSKTACREKPLDIKRVTTASENWREVSDDDDDDDDVCDAGVDEGSFLFNDVSETASTKFKINYADSNTVSLPTIIWHFL